MNQKRSSLPNDVQSCHDMIHQLGETVGEQQREVEQLKHFIDRLLRQRFGARSEKIAPNQMSLFDEPETAEEAADPEDDEPPPMVVSAHRRRGGGRNKLPDHLPRERVEHDLTESEKRCPCCDQTRKRIGEVSHEQLEFIPASLKVIEHVRFKYACRKCEEHVALAPVPARPIAKGFAGPGLLSTILVGKYSDHLPLYRHESILSRNGVQLSRSTMSRWVLETAELLQPLTDLMKNRVLQSHVVHTDDTTVPVQDNRLSRTRTGRFWVYCGDAAHPYSVYDFTPNRERAGPQAFLEHFCGYLQADAYAGYEELYRSGRIQQVLCWAHARRKFYDARTVQPEAAHRALSFIQQLYTIEREAGELKSDLQQPADREHWWQRRWQLRQDKALPVLEQFRDWLTETSRALLPKSPVAAAIQYLLSRWSGFTRYCTEGILSIDNNLAERTLRPCAIGRKNYLFVGSERGGQAAAVHYSLMASCKANEVEPFAYLRDVLARITDHAVDRLEELLPDQWLKQHPEAHRPRRR
ncbi:IS66 family transposase [Gimesia sp.]|uniref:IS66 family transposase n=1 Tax=Gimesia sp. TaxID=2024833 RepID=UPI0025BCEC03|nr:IS66 family transposase [Gimesia sp.]